jgi:SPP1 gp7 family putative phage head morphogenesis protein
MPRRSLRPFHSQEERLLARSEAAAEAVDRAVARLWREILAILRPGTPWFVVHREVSAALRRLPETLAVVAKDLADTVADSIRSGRATLADQVRTSAPRPLTEDSGTATDRLVSFAFDTVFAAPSQDEVYGIVYSSGWQRRFAELTTLADPDSLAAVVANSIARGETPRQAAAAIRPLVQDVGASARRIARHESIRVAHEARFAAYEQLGEFVEGYQIHAVLDSRTRPEHRRRDGTIYWRNPKPGQRSMAEMPRPPMEADGSIAFNCRCWLSPVLGS